MQVIAIAYVRRFQTVDTALFYAVQTAGLQMTSIPLDSFLPPDMMPSSLYFDDETILNVTANVDSSSVGGNGQHEDVRLAAGSCMLLLYHKLKYEEIKPVIIELPHSPADSYGAIYATPGNIALLNTSIPLHAVTVDFRGPFALNDSLMQIVVRLLQESHDTVTSLTMVDCWAGLYPGNWLMLMHALPVSLHSLVIVGDILYDRYLMCLSDSFANRSCPLLQRLVLRHNTSVTLRGVCSLLNALHELHDLGELSLDDMTCDIFFAFGELSTGSFKSLRYLDIRRGAWEYSSIGVCKFARALAEMPLLTKLDFSGTYIGAHGMAVLAEAMCSFFPGTSLLGVLILTGCGLGDAGLEHLVPALAHVTSLREINLNSNGLSDRSMLALVCFTLRNNIY